MTLIDYRLPRPRVAWTLCLCALTAALGTAARAQQTKLDVLRIGSSGTLAASPGTKETAALQTLQVFIKEETGLTNDIIRQTDWRVLAAKLAKGELQVGVFQGYEFAWAVEQFPELKPLAAAVNVYVYPVAFVVTRKDDSAKDFAGLKGKTLALPATGQPFLKLFIERQAQASGAAAETFLAKVTNPEYVEDALDDVVDSKVQAAVVDRAALEAYKRRKPGRFKQLRPIAQSEKFPPPVVAYYNANLDEGTLERFKNGLLGASKKEKGEMMLTLFHLTGFEPVPSDFGQVLAETRKRYPPQNGKGG